MNKVTTLCAIVSVILISVIAFAIMSNRVIPETFGINGTCGGGNMTDGKNQTLISNLNSQGYFKNLTTDNPQLAELVKTC
jgi:hypothetical protein